MKYGQFMAALRKNGPKHVILLAGEERYYIEKAERAVLASLCPDEDALGTVARLERDPSPRDLAALIETAPLFAERNILLLRGCELFREKRAVASPEKKPAGKSKPEKDMERLAELFANMPDTSYVIFESGAKADKRKKLYKAVEKSGAVLEAEPERPWTIDEWLRGKLAEMGRSFDREAHAFFMEAVGMMQTISLSFLDSELEKLALYTDAKRFSRDDIARVFANMPEVSGFALLDAVSARDVRRALMLLERQIADGVYLPLILAGLVRHVRQLWQAKRLAARGVRGRALGQPLELNPFIAEKLGRFAEAFDEKILRRVFLELADADYLLKTGQAGPELLESAVISLCGGGAPGR